MPELSRTQSTPIKGTRSLSIPPAVPTSSLTSTSLSRGYLPFNFGFEAEVILRPKYPANHVPELQIPSSNASPRETRQFNFTLIQAVANILSGEGMTASVYIHNDDSVMDYSNWTVVTDASLSKAHIKDGFYPLEIVSPVITANSEWVKTVNRFWAVLTEHFEFRRDTTCSFHIHISFATGNYSLPQLRSMAKAIIFWEPATSRCAPLSKQDHVNGFCKSVMKDNPPLVNILKERGPLRGLSLAFDYINKADRDSIVDFICPDRYRAWNFKPSRTGGHGSIEFRRPPGVVTAKKAKHWLAFAMTFLDMAVQFNPEILAANVETVDQLEELEHPDFQEQFLECAKGLGVYSQLDARLFQSDEPRSLYVSMLTADRIAWLLARDPDYRYSVYD